MLPDPPSPSLDRTSRRPTLRARFAAWWDGYYLDEPGDSFIDALDLSDGPLLLTERAPPEIIKETADDALKIWPRWRIEAAEMIWGASLISPGDTESIVHLAKPLGLNPALNLLDLTAGLGPGTRGIAQNFGVWVTGLEADPDLAREGGERSRKGEFERKAPISLYDPETIEFKPRSFDCIMGREPFLTVRDKKRLLRAISRGLREKGQLLFTEILVPDRGARSGAFGAWLQRERPAPSPWGFDEMSAYLAEIELDVRIDEDMTPLFRSQILNAFALMARNIENRTIPRYLLPKVMDEAERWNAWVQAIDAGDIKRYRFHALNRATG